MIAIPQGITALRRSGEATVPTTSRFSESDELQPFIHAHYSMGSEKQSRFAEPINFPNDATLCFKVAKRLPPVVIFYRE